MIREKEKKKGKNLSFQFIEGGKREWCYWFYVLVLCFSLLFGVITLSVGKKGNGVVDLITCVKLNASVK